MIRLTGKGKHIVMVGNHSCTNMISKPAIMRREYKCQIVEKAFAIKRPVTYNNLVYIDSYIKTLW